MKKLIALLLVFTQSAWAGLPPTTVQGQADASPKTKFAFQVPNNQATDLGGIKALIETGSDDVLANPTFQATGVSSSVVPSWTLAGAGVTAGVSTSPTFGNDPQVLQLTLSSATGDLLSQDVTPKSTASFAGINLENSLWVYAPTSGVTLQVCARLSAADVSGACVSVPNIGGWAYVPSAGSVGGSGSAGVSLFASASSTGTVYVTHGYVGRNRNIGTVAQAILLGAVKITGCAGGWATSGTSFASSGAQTSCSYATINNALAPATNVSAIKFASMPPGDYAIEFEGGVQQTTASKVSYFQFTDGTNTAREISEAGGAGNMLVPGVRQSFTYTTTQSNVTWEMFAKTDSGGTAQWYGTTTQPAVIKVWYYPSQSQTVASLANASANWSGYQNGIAGGCATSSTTFADPSACTSIALNQTTARNISCLTAGSSLSGIACTLPKLGMHHVSADLSVTNSAGHTVSARLVDGSGTVIDPGRAQIVPTGSGGNSWTLHLEGDYNAASVSPTFKVQLATDSGGSAQIFEPNSAPAASAAIQWQVYQKDSPGPQPYATGNVSSTTTGQEHIERALISGAGACAITSQSGSWISSTSHVSTGICTINFTAGEWSSAPSCVVSTDNVASSVARVAEIQTTPTTSSTQVITNNSTPAVADFPFHIICMGPK